MAPYEIVDGLEIDGNNDTASDQCVGNIDETAYPNTHHLVIENNIIHGCGGHGISLNYNEYWWVLGNTIYSNGGSGSQYYEAGVYVYAPQNEATISTGFSPNSADLALTYHITIAGNTIYNNFCHTNSCSGPAATGRATGSRLMTWTIAPTVVWPIPTARSQSETTSTAMAVTAYLAIILTT